MVSGEAISPDLWERLAVAPGAVVNVYGLTECTVDSTAAPVTPDSGPILGRLLPNATAYVLDSALQPVPIV